MRALLVRAARATALVFAPLAAFAGIASAANTVAPVALHAGDAITDRQLFAYLSVPVSAGDWVRYRVRFADRSTVEKTIGFGSENVGGRKTLFIETHVRAQGVTGIPGTDAIPIGTDAVLKTYVAGAAFGDLAHPYGVIASALKIGDFEYEVKPGPGQTFSALTGAEDWPARDGTVRSVDAVDIRVAGRVAHCTHVTAWFRSAPLPLGGVQVPYTLDVWQSPDVALGTVIIASDGGRAIDWHMIAYGRGYKSLFVKTLDRIRQASQPGM